MYDKIISVKGGIRVIYVLLTGWFTVKRTVAGFLICIYGKRQNSLRLF